MIKMITNNSIKLATAAPIIIMNMLLELVASDEFSVIVDKAEDGIAEDGTAEDGKGSVEIISGVFDLGDGVVLSLVFPHEGMLRLP
jgi:hypothetical protein